MAVHVTVIINWFWNWIVMSLFLFSFLFPSERNKCCKTDMLDFAWWKENDIVVKYFLFRITDFVLMLHSLMFEVTYNVVLLVFLFAWKRKCCCNTDVRHTFLLAWWGKKKACGSFLKTVYHAGVRFSAAALLQQKCDYSAFFVLLWNKDIKKTYGSYDVFLFCVDDDCKHKMFHITRFCQLPVCDMLSIWL